MGRPKLEEPLVKPVLVRFSEKEYERLQKCAKLNKTTVTQFIREAATKEVDSQV